MSNKTKTSINPIYYVNVLSFHRSCMLRLSFGKKMFTCSSLLTVPYWLTGVKQYWVLIYSDWNIALHELDRYQRGWLRHEALALVSFFRSADANTSETLLRLLFICLNTIAVCLKMNTIFPGSFLYYFAPLRFYYTCPGIPLTWCYINLAILYV